MFELASQLEPQSTYQEAKLAAYAVKIDYMPEQNIKLNTCIDKINPKLFGGPNSYERLRPWRCLKNRFQSINEEQSCSGMNDAPESAGGLRDMEFAKLELKKEQKHKKVSGAELSICRPPRGE